MKSVFRNFFSIDDRNTDYIKLLAFSPLAALLIWQQSADIATSMLFVASLYFFIISLTKLHLIIPNIKPFKEGWCLLPCSLILGYLYLAYGYWFVVKWSILILALIYTLSVVAYYDKLHLIYYFFYKRILAKSIGFLVTIFHNTYNLIFVLSLPLLTFFFSIYLFEKIGHVTFSSPTLNNLMLYLGDSLYNGFNHTHFIQLLALNILLIGGLLTIRYAKEIWLLAYRYVVSWYGFSFFTVLITLYALVFTLKGNFNYQDIPSLGIQAGVFSLIVYMLLVPFKKMASFQWEGKNKLFKKIYKQTFWTNSKISAIQQNKIIDRFFEELDRFLAVYLDYAELKRNYFVLLDDNPISPWDKEIFPIKRFTESIFDIINWYSFSAAKWEKSFSIGLVGEWGSWKSSVINSLKETYIDGYPEYQVMEFNPWNFEKKIIIESFFNELSHTIWGNKITKLFNKYLASLGELHKWFDFLIKNLRSDTTIEHIKQELNKELKKLANKKVVVIIDDLDRCEPWEVLVILNIIKNLWDLTNIIYLVSYDKDNIIKVLEKAWFDKTYLDKIINIERYLPKNRKQEIKAYFLEHLDRIVGEIFSKKQLDQERQKKMWEEMVSSMRPLLKMAEEQALAMGPLVKSIEDIWKNIAASIQPFLQSEWINKSSPSVLTDSPAIPDKAIEVRADEAPASAPETSWYLPVSKEDLLRHIEEKFDTIFERENLRLIKKLINQLNILFLTNLYTWKEHKEVYAFSLEDYATIVLFNYLKIKDYWWFSEVLDFRLLNFWGERSRQGCEYYEWEMPGFIKRIYLEDLGKFEKEYIWKLFSIVFLTKHERDAHNADMSTITNIGISLRPTPIEWTLKIILEKFS